MSDTVPIFLESTSSNRAYKNKVDEILDLVISDQSTELCIIGFVDNSLMPKLEQCANRTKIICKEEKKLPRAVQEAQKRLLDFGAEIRELTDFHARLILFNNQIIIGSGDLQALSLNGNRADASIWTDNDSVVEDAKTFFNQHWLKSTPVGETKLLFTDFSEYDIGPFKDEAWNTHLESGTLDIVPQSDLGGKPTEKCLKITSIQDSQTWASFQFRDSIKIRLKYKMRQQEFNEKGLGSGFHVLYTPKPEQVRIKENMAIWMGIRYKSLQWNEGDYPNAYEEICSIEPRKWYNVELIVDCESDTFNVKVNGKGYSGNFRHSIDSVNTIRTNGWNHQPKWSTYFDRVELYKIK